MKSKGIFMSNNIKEQILNGETVLGLELGSTRIKAVLTKEYLANMTEKAKESVSEELEYFFSFWYRHRSYLKLLYDQELFHILMNRFSDYLSRDGKKFDEEELNTYIIPYTSGGLWATLFTWTQRNFADPPEKIAG